MPLEDTNPRLEAIIMEVKTRQSTRYEGYVPRADELLVAEIDRLRARLALADGLAEACDELTGWCGLVSVDPNDRHDITKMREWASKVIDRTAACRNAE